LSAECARRRTEERGGERRRGEEERGGEGRNEREEGGERRGEEKGGERRGEESEWHRYSRQQYSTSQHYLYTKARDGSIPPNAGPAPLVTRHVPGRSTVGVKCMSTVGVQYEYSMSTV
jgi:hypothetical protein